MNRLSNRVKMLKQSGIRSASKRCAALNGINLGQGICDLPIHPLIKDAAKEAIFSDKNIYGACEGLYPLRQTIAEKIRRFNHVNVCPKSEIMVSHGASGAFVCAIKTLFNPGDEVILFEPFYGYHRGILSLFDISIKTSPIDLNGFALNLDQLEAIITEKTKGIVICTPNNPTGKVFTKEELQAIGELALKHQLMIITDEIYEYITYPNHQHVSMASLGDELKQQTLTISGMSKTFNMTGWRLGYASGPRDIIEKMSLVQDLLYVCPVTPLQHAVVEALALDDDYYHTLRSDFLKKRDITAKALSEMGFSFTLPQGAYYILAKHHALDNQDDANLADMLLENTHVASVAGEAFYTNPSDGQQQIRLCYALKEERLHKAFEQMASFIRN